VSKLINDAFDIISARIVAGIASPGDRACYYVLGTSAFRQVPGTTYSGRDCEVVDAIRESLADSIIAAERGGTHCPRCNAPYRLTQTCEECTDDDE
jgi:hypothetical protein